MYNSGVEILAKGVYGFSTVKHRRLLGINTVLRINPNSIIRPGIGVITAGVVKGKSFRCLNVTLAAEKYHLRSNNNKTHFPLQLPLNSAEKIFP